MALPTASDVYDYLEGYGISTTLLSTAWLEKRRDQLVIPWIEKHTRLKLSAEEEVTEYLSGNGGEILVLSRKPINSLTSIEYIRSDEGLYNLLSLVEIDYKEGILIATTNIAEAVWHSTFQKGNKNIKVVYKTGLNDFVDPRTSAVANDIKEAIIMMVAKRGLILIGARTGGGSLGVQSHSRNYGARGKYTDIINELDAASYEILKSYMTGIIGS